MAPVKFVITNALGLVEIEMLFKGALAPDGSPGLKPGSLGSAWTLA